MVQTDLIPGIYLPTHDPAPCLKAIDGNSRSWESLCLWSGREWKPERAGPAWWNWPHGAGGLSSQMISSELDNAVPHPQTAWFFSFWFASWSSKASWTHTASRKARLCHSSGLPRLGSHHFFYHGETCVSDLPRWEITHILGWSKAKHTFFYHKT